MTSRYRLLSLFIECCLSQLRVTAQMLLVGLHVACDTSQVLLGYESRVWEGEIDMDSGLYSHPPSTVYAALMIFFSSTLSYKFAKAAIGGIWAYRIIFDIPNCSPARASKLVDAGEGSAPAFPFLDKTP
jgi:hypothetical protein